MLLAAEELQESGGKSDDETEETHQESQRSAPKTVSSCGTSTQSWNLWIYFCSEVFEKKHGDAAIWVVAAGGSIRQGWQANCSVILFILIEWLLVVIYWVARRTHFCPPWFAGAVQPSSALSEPRSSIITKKRDDRPFPLFCCFCP